MQLNNLNNETNFTRARNSHLISLKCHVIGATFVNTFMGRKKEIKNQNLDVLNIFELHE